MKKQKRNKTHPLPIPFLRLVPFAPFLSHHSSCSILLLHFFLLCSFHSISFLLGLSVRLFQFRDKGMFFSFGFFFCSLYSIFTNLFFYFFVHSIPFPFSLSSFHFVFDLWDLFTISFITKVCLSFFLFLLLFFIFRFY